MSVDGSNVTESKDHEPSRADATLRSLKSSATIVRSAEQAATRLSSASAEQAAASAELRTGVEATSSIDVSRAISLYVPGAGKPSERMRSAMVSTASHSSLYCVSNIRCSVLNIGPSTFQWKLWVCRYSE